MNSHRREARFGGRCLAHAVMPFVLALPATALTPDLDAALAAAGLKTIDPPSAATDFELPRLGGGSGRLSDYRGQWVVLTFWASWCGPCRSEMPSLERLYRERAREGLVVVGVAVDSEPAPAAAFYERYGLSFPSYHDDGGRVAGRYRAASIPLSYLVDPRGYLVAVARGARDWSRMRPVMDAALAAVPPGDDHPPVYAQAGPVELPEITEPPTADVRVSEAAPRAGRPFELEVQLRWAGDFEEYLPQPPAVELPEGVVRQGVTAETSSRDGRNLVTYRIALIADAPGRYALDPIELRYLPRFEAEPMAARVAGPTVEVGAARSNVLGAGAAAGGALAVAAIGAAVALGYRHRRRASQKAEPEQGFPALEEAFGEARARRLRGDLAGFLVELARLEDVLGEASENERRELAKMVEETRFGGRVPPPSEMDNIQRRVERRLEARRPDARRAEREKVRLREVAAAAKEEIP